MWYKPVRARDHVRVGARRVPAFGTTSFCGSAEIASGVRAQAVDLFNTGIRESDAAATASSSASELPFLQPLVESCLDSINVIVRWHCRHFIPNTKTLEIIGGWFYLRWKLASERKIDRPITSILWRLVFDYLVHRAGG
jgi:hypothetical protein